MTDILKYVAEQNGMSLENVRQEMQAAIDAAWENPDGAELQQQLFPDGKPTPEAFIRTLTCAIEQQLFLRSDFMKYEYIKAVYYGDRLDYFSSQNVIDECAGEDKRYIGWMPTEIDRDNGRIKEITLIFEVPDSTEPDYQKYLDKRSNKRKIENWGFNHENETMKGYILYALKMIEENEPSLKLSSEQRDALMRGIKWATSDLTTQEAFEYYCKE